MSRFGILSKAVVWLATWNLAAPAGLLCAAPPESSRPLPAVRDVALGQGGTLRGQFRTRQDQPLSRRVVTIQKSGGATVTTSTDQQGRFSVPGLQGGVYRISAGDANAVCRLWTPQTSPPAAAPAVLLVDQSQTVQRGQRPICDIITNPLVIGLAIAAAIAIPVALNNSSDDTPSGS